MSTYVLWSISYCRNICGGNTDTIRIGYNFKPLDLKNGFQMNFDSTNLIFKVIKLGFLKSNFENIYPIFANQVSLLFVGRVYKTKDNFKNDTVVNHIYFIALSLKINCLTFFFCKFY